MAEAATTGGETPIVMPKLGLSMTEGLLAEWLVQPGDEVAAGQMLFVVETDKITSEVEAPADGRIVSLLAAAGDTVNVGTPVALWTGAARVGAARSAELAPAALQGPILTGPQSAAGRILSTPLARRLAAKEGIAIADVCGTGPRDRIQARDVRAALERGSTDRPAAAQLMAPTAIGRDLRPLIAARVSRSKAEIPHFYVTADAVFDALIALRGDLNADPRAPRKLSVTVFLAAAVGRALAIFPEANAVWRENHAKPLARIAIGIAVDTPAGVTAPVVPVGGKGLYAMARDLDSAIAHARTGRLRADDVGDAAIGISNVGMFAVRALTPIIDPDQSFMLGVGAARAVFRPGVDGAPKMVQEVTLTLACDHRAIDGAAASRFLATIVELLEHPLRLMIPSE